MSTAGHTSERILAYGHDSILLKTRCMVLEQAGFHVDAVSSAEEFQGRIAQAKIPYRVFLLGHSIPPTEQSIIVASVVKSPTLIYPLSELVPPQQLICDLHKLLCDDDDSRELS